MRGLRTQSDEIPEHVGILQMSGRIALLGVDEAGEQDRVPDEEDRRVIADQVPDAVFGVEFNSEPSRIANRVRGSGLSTDRGESHGDRGLLADFGKDAGGRVLGDVVGDLEVTESSRSFSVDHALWNTLPVEVGDFLDEGHVL